MEIKKINEELLNNLDLAAQELFITLDQLSAQIQILEKKLQEKKINFPFSMIVKEETNQEPYEVINHYFSWEKDHDIKIKCYRLFYKIEKTVFQNNQKLKEETFRKVLAECNLELRIEMLPYLNKFIEELIIHFKTTNNKIKGIL